jgi:class 3 adenylate cyclase/ligand-binding sensor domain-containing protein
MKFSTKFSYTVVFSIICSVFSLTAQVFPSDYVNRIWTAADGLPGNAATDIIQSKDGYIYIGTYDGLVKFDGFDFTILSRNSDDRYPFVSARSVFQDSKGNLWVGANDEGVVEISADKKAKIFTKENGLPNNSIRAFAEDRTGNIWIGTAAGVAFISQDGTVHAPQGLDAYDDEQALVVSMYCDTAGRIWVVSSKTHGIYYYVGNSFQRYEALDRFGDYLPTAVGQSSSGTFWFGLSQQGVVSVDNDQVQRITSHTAMDTTSVNHIYLDQNGSLWFATEQGLVLYRDGTFSIYTEADGLTNNNVKKVVQDREGNIWLATDRGGIEKLSMGKFRMENIGTTVNTIAEGKDKLVWIGTDDGLRCYNQRNEELHNSLTEKCRNLRIRHVGITQNGDVLVSCYSKPGQLRYNGTAIRSWTTDEGLAGNKTRLAVECSNGDVYVGTTTGLSIIHASDGSVRSFTREQGLSNDYIMWIYEDTDRQMWIGTDGGGINIMAGEKVIGQLTTSDGLAGNVIFKIMQDKKGIFWICTGTGITRYDRRTKAEQGASGGMFNYTAAQGLGSDSVFQVLIDYTDTVWMTSNRGISCVQLSDMDSVMNGGKKTVDSKFFNKNDGLRSGGVTSTSLSMCDTYGRLWFTLIDGFAIYDPIKAKSNDILPLVNIESVRLDEKPVADLSSVIRIPAGTKRIDIKYTGLSFISPERVRFKYMLSGFETKYSDPVKIRTVSYTNLKPGKYTFDVMAANGDGTWCKDPYSVAFVQQPFFYQQVWFWIVCCMSLAGLIVLGIRIHDRDAKRRQEQLEQMVEIKTADLERERDKSERLLRNILPVSIADRLKEPKAATVADRFDEATVLFSDIVGFTAITSHESPEDIVTALNDLVSRFDIRAEQCGVEKIKTIGDAYMAVCGVPVPNEDHAAVMVRFARGMYHDLAEYNKTAKIPFKIRIGLNSGPVIAGVIGRNKFIYDLWGDTVNVASRMENLCRPGEILVTEAVRSRVEKSGATITFHAEGALDIKGKGQMNAFMTTA